MTTLFIAGIDTDVGKSVACGVLAKALLEAGHKVFTQKWVETGVDGASAKTSADLAMHEKIVGRNFNTQAQSLHAPYLFSMPASPHLAARQQEVKIEPAYLKSQTRRLEQRCDHLLIEGAGGLCVPLTEGTLIIDLVHAMSLPLILVTSGKLGSLNHTMLSLDYCQKINIDVRAVMYNFYPDENPIIREDSRRYLRAHIDQIYPNAAWLDLPLGARELALTTTDLCKLLL